MKIHYKIIIFAFALSVLGVIVWSASHYHDKYQAERLRADAAEQNANAAEAITANVIRSVNIINAIAEANQDAKNQITLESQGAQADIKVAVADDDCAVRIVPSGAVKRLHEYANGIRVGAGRSVTSQSDG
ncbi:DUF2570 domain-containing protein [Shigella flexneri]|nr:DUF2570 domain-containing protein [Escherichia coli]EFP9427098.1 DUF2570 domain-containing protein [Shigella flexneri]EFW2832194.1 DUF2570 domain-containing protein [Shigella flexneri]EFX6107026.1 DUF2570 domain-containing protein [Shigella flexneri]EGE1984486.1 DUF2570 domain-containing protein [Shigella flexneri]ELL2475043.1 DUF2570 domain-containing protein [Escherichia coli]